MTKVAVITGGSQGIGAGLVAAYREQGWSVVASARKIAPSDDPALVTVAGDIAAAETANQIIGAALEKFGRVDTLVNDAGVFMSKPFTEYTDADYELMAGVNLGGFFRLTQRAITAMLAGGDGGHVVGITTTLVESASSAVPSMLTSLTKGGIAAAVRALAVEYARHGIRVNAVAPGVIQTPLNPPESYAASARLAPMGRVGQVSDIVGAILYLESAQFVTGEILHVDGGQIAGH